MRTAMKEKKRYTVVSIPGRREDGSDTAWFVYDLWQAGSKRAVRCDSFEAARKLARGLNGK